MKKKKEKPSLEKRLVKLEKEKNSSIKFADYCIKGLQCLSAPAFVLFTLGGAATIFASNAEKKSKELINKEYGRYKKKSRNNN